MNNRLPALQQGLSLVMAIFILVLLSLLGTAMINIIAGGTESVAREVISARALFLAESGAQRMLNETFPPGSTASVTTACDSAPFNYPSFGGIEGCSNQSVTIDCTQRTVNSANYYTIISTASCGPANELAVRVVEVQAKDL